VGLGVSLNQVSAEVLSTVTMVGIVTIFISTYLIFYSDSLYKYLAPILSIFERKRTRERSIRTEKHPVILIGSGRMSYDFIKLFKKQEAKFLVLDHDPEIMTTLENEEIAHEYGDASDPDLLDDLKIQEAELIISTIPDLETNLIVLSAAKRGDKKPVVIVVAHRINNALELYEAGADYVILPHFLGGKYAASLVKRHTEGVEHIKEIREKHITQLQNRKEIGQEHPQLERLR
jgi:voltage-gated potassium channel Kch